MINYAEGNLLKANTEALVNTVNCVGVMGKGIALQFKQAYPANFKLYEKACKEDNVKLGQMLIVEIGQTKNPRYIINFPTKQHWKAKSRLSDIESGLKALVDEIKQRKIKSVALPALGCGNGGLEWNEVKPLIEKAFESLVDVEFIIFPPATGPKSNEMSVNTAKENLTRARALLIRLINLYWLGEDDLGKLEIQKLAYFLQVAGEPLNLRFKKQQFGPYADNLNHVLQRLEGHYIRGYGDRQQYSEIRLLPGALEDAKTILQNDTEANQRLERVAALIKGYETPYGLELLATVHWVTAYEANWHDKDVVIGKIHAWSVRKREKFKTSHILKAWERLKEQNWFDVLAEATK